MQCLVDNPRCQKPVFMQETGSVLIVGFKLPTGNLTNVVRKYKGVELGSPTTMTLKMCYSAGSTSDRKWRKANDKISKDKRCGIDIAEGIDLAMHTGFSLINYTLPSDTPKARFFITAFLKCPVGGYSNRTQTCGLDTTGGLDALVTKEAVMNKMGISGTVEAVDAKMKLKTSKIIYFKTMSSHHQPALLVGGVIGFSIFSVALLAFFLVYEHVLRKKK
ncbi:hypothetical protein BSKO_09854 [Bryopsis sp. KO-2023]|nr:hypothetical protein BSKO_09854 [Bryopsis sp. KO-2023]